MYVLIQSFSHAWWWLRFSKEYCLSCLNTLLGPSYQLGEKVTERTPVVYLTILFAEHVFAWLAHQTWRSTGFCLKNLYVLSIYSAPIFKTADLFLQYFFGGYWPNPTSLKLVYNELLERAREKEEKEAKKRRRLADDFTDLLCSYKVLKIALNFLTL